jgi:hypothetical protein
MSTTHIYWPLSGADSLPTKYQQECLSDFQASSLKPHQSVTITSQNQDYFRLEHASSFSQHKFQDTDPTYESDCANHLVSYKDPTETQEAEITYNLNNIQSTQKKLVPFPENSQKCLNSINQESSDAKSTTDENVSQQPEDRATSHLLNNSNELEAKSNFVGEGMKNSGVPFGPKSKKETLKGKNPKKTKSKFAKYISDDAEFNNLRSIIQQEDLNNYFSAINSNLTTLKIPPTLVQPIKKSSEISDFNFQNFKGHSQITNPNPSLRSKAMFPNHSSAQEHTGLLEKILNPEDYLSILPMPTKPLHCYVNPLDSRSYNGYSEKNYFQGLDEGSCPKLSNASTGDGSELGEPLPRKVSQGEESDESDVLGQSETSHLMKAIGCLDTSVEKGEDSGDELFGELDQYYVNFDERAERMTLEEMAEIDAKWQAELEQQQVEWEAAQEDFAVKHAERLVLKQQRKVEKLAERYVEIERRKAIKREKKRQFWLEKQARHIAMNMPIAPVESEPTPEQGFSHEQYLSSSANEQYYYENLEKSRMVHQYAQEPRVEPQPRMVQIQPRLAPHMMPPMQAPNAKHMPPRDPRMLLPPPQAMVRAPYQEPRLIRVAGPPPPGYHLAGPPPPPAYGHPMGARPVIRRIVRVPMQQPISNEEILRQEHARFEYDRAVAIENDRREHERREEFLREQERREYMAAQENERRHQEMLRYEASGAQGYYYPEDYHYPTYRAENRPSSTLETNYNTDPHYYQETPNHYIAQEESMVPQHNYEQGAIYAEDSQRFYYPESCSGPQRSQYENVYYDGI